MLRDLETNEMAMVSGGNESYPIDTTSWVDFPVNSYSEIFGNTFIFNGAGDLNDLSEAWFISGMNEQLPENVSVEDVSIPGPSDPSAPTTDAPQNLTGTGLVFTLSNGNTVYLGGNSSGTIGGGVVQDF